MSADSGALPSSPGSRQIRLGVLSNYVNHDLDSIVSTAYENALSTLSSHGIELINIKLSDLDELPALNSQGGLIAAEAFGWHRDYLENAFDEYDPRVSSRIMKGAEQNAADYIRLLNARKKMICNTHAVTREFDAVIFPTVPIIAPTLKELEDDAHYATTNLLVLRNPTVANFLDRCAISIPMTEKENAPAGLMLMGEHGEDRSLLALAQTLERLLGFVK